MLPPHPSATDMTGRPLAGPAAPTVRAGLARQTVGGVAPLDAQFGADEKQTVPDRLRPVLFPGDGMSTYAILDAAKVPNLPEMLETSGLMHRCLFTGAAREDFGRAAPWIVRLEAGAPLTRCLFSRSDAPWHLWDAAPGIFVLSDGDLDAVSAHFRKFTRVQDADGAWFFFRFWEPSIWDGIAAGDEAFARRLLGPHRVVYRARAAAEAATFRVVGDGT